MNYIEAWEALITLEEALQELRRCGYSEAEIERLFARCGPLGELDGDVLLEMAGR